MGDLMNHVDEGTIHTWLDGAMAPDEGARVERHVASCPACSGAAAEARGLIAASSRILSTLDAVPGGVIPGSAGEADQLASLRRRTRPVRRPWWRQRQFLAAASLVLVAGTATAAWRLWERGSASQGLTSPSASADLARENGAAQAPTTPPGAGLEPADPGTPAEREGSVTARQPLADQPTIAGAGIRPADSAPRADRAELDRVIQAAASRTESVAANEARAAEARPSLAVPLGAAVSLGTQGAKALASQPQAAEPKRLAAEQQGRSAADSLRQASPPAGTGAGSLLAGRPDSIGVAGIVASAIGRSASASGYAIGCYELRGPAPVGGRLLGVPGGVRLVDEVLPQGADSTWRRAEESEPSGVAKSLIWRVVDSTTVEMRVRRPLDSTVVRFRARPISAPLSQAELPRGVEVAEATRVVCR